MQGPWRRGEGRPLSDKPVRPHPPRSQRPVFLTGGGNQGASPPRPQRPDGGAVQSKGVEPIPSQIIT